MKNVIGNILKKSGMFCLFFLTCRTVAQSPLSLGIGGSSTAFLVNFEEHPYPVPSLPFSPHATVKIQQHEILAGPDLYLFKNNPAIIGVQATYRYHLRKGSKIFDPFAEANFQFVRFKNGAGNPERYNSAIRFGGVHAVLMAYQSFLNTYGIGLQLNIKDRVRFYSVFGAGYNYRHQMIVYNYSWDNDIPQGNLVSFTGYIRLGASFFFYREKVQ